jgi:hypothetical protein
MPAGWMSLRRPQVPEIPFRLWVLQIRWDLRRRLLRLAPRCLFRPLVQLALQVQRVLLGRQVLLGLSGRPALEGRLLRQGPWIPVRPWSRWDRMVPWPPGVPVVL